MADRRGGRTCGGGGRGRGCDDMSSWRSPEGDRPTGGCGWPAALARTAGARWSNAGWLCDVLMWRGADGRCSTVKCRPLSMTEPRSSGGSMPPKGGGRGPGGRSSAATAAWPRGGCTPGGGTEAPAAAAGAGTLSPPTPAAAPLSGSEGPRKLRGWPAGGTPAGRWGPSPTPRGHRCP